jgi:histidyl-tRNA synthetase
VATEVDYHARSLKAQMKEASRLGARYAALLGEDELSSGQVTTRDMNTGEQQRAARAEVAARVQALLRTAPTTD